MLEWGRIIFVSVNLLNEHVCISNMMFVTPISFSPRPYTKSFCLFITLVDSTRPIKLLTQSFVTQWWSNLKSSKMFLNVSQQCFHRTTSLVFESHRKIFRKNLIPVFWKKRTFVYQCSIKSTDLSMENTNLTCSIMNHRTKWAEIWHVI